MNRILVWDLETVPDLDGFARANGLTGSPPEKIREALGEGFPKLIYHSIVCIGALVAERVAEGWSVKAVGAPHVGDRPEKILIESFVKRIEETQPQMITFNGCSFDLPVLRYRAMTHNVSAPGLSSRSYYHRYRDDAVDLCDVLSSFSFGAKATLQELSLIMGLPGKSNGISGSDVETYYRSGRIEDISKYCQSDVINTYRLWLRYELFRGNLSQAQFDFSDLDTAISQQV